MANRPSLQVHVHPVLCITGLYCQNTCKTVTLSLGLWLAGQQCAEGDCNTIHVNLLCMCSSGNREL